MARPDRVVMTTPRRLLVDPVDACDYHPASRCAQGAFPLRPRPPHRTRQRAPTRWLVDRARLPACCSAVAIPAYCIMGSRFHPVARHDPLAGCRWRDEEAARRRVDAFPATQKG